MRQIGTATLDVACAGSEWRLRDTPLLRALLQRLGMAFDLTAYGCIVRHSLRLMDTLVVIVLAEIFEAMAGGVMEQLAGSERYILQGDPTRGELARDGVGHVGGILAHVLRRTSQVSERV